MELILREEGTGQSPDYRSTDKLADRGRATNFLSASATWRHGRHSRPKAQDRFERTPLAVAFVLD